MILHFKIQILKQLTMILKMRKKNVLLKIMDIVMIVFINIKYTVMIKFYVQMKIMLIITILIITLK